MSVLTEGGVSSCILSFAGSDFLYTGGVCTSWKANAPTKSTCILGALSSVSRMLVALSADIDTDELLDLAIVFGADMEVLRLIGDEITCSTPLMVNYAAHTGNMGTILSLDEPFDEFTIFEAVRGGQHHVVKHMIDNGCEVNIMAEWPSGFYDDETFVQKCLGMAESTGRRDVVDSLTAYVTGDHYRSDMGCVKLSIRTNRPDILRLLQEAGAVIPASAFALAVESANLDTLRYLESLERSPGDGFIADYVACEEFDITTLELLLEMGMVELHARDLVQAIHARMKPVTDLLLRLGCCVHDETVDHAIAEWDFALAATLMSSHACHPTSNAYEWLFTGGFCECCVAGFYPVETDAFYLAKLEWIYLAADGHLGFGSMAEMEADASWSILFKRVSGNIKAWFENHVDSKKQRVV